MLSTRWQPASNLLNPGQWFQSEMNRMLGAAENEMASSINPYPPLCAWEENDTLFVESELPGVELEDLEIYVSQRKLLTIQGERKQPDIESSKWHRQERLHGKFSRTITLPFEVNEDDVQAELTNGILTLELPKSEAAKPRRIGVRSS